MIVSKTTLSLKSKRKPATSNACITNRKCCPTISAVSESCNNFKSCARWPMVGASVTIGAMRRSALSGMSWGGEHRRCSNISRILFVSLCFSVAVNSCPGDFADKYASLNRIFTRSPHSHILLRMRSSSSFAALTPDSMAFSAALSTCAYSFATRARQSPGLSWRNAAKTTAVLVPQIGHPPGIDGELKVRLYI